MQEPRIETTQEKKLLGMKLRMSFANNSTAKLWQTFMPRKKEIENMVGINLYSMEVYSPGFFDNFNMANEFDKWAVVEVTDYNSVPDGMEPLILPTGTYAVFDYKGIPSEAVKLYQHIFMTWLPNSIYKVDTRPHFALMGAKYKNNDPDSEEEIWIPVEAK